MGGNERLSQLAWGKSKITCSRCSYIGEENILAEGRLCYLINQADIVTRFLAVCAEPYIGVNQNNRNVIHLHLVMLLDHELA